MKTYYVKYTKSDDFCIEIKANNKEEAKNLADTKLNNMTNEEIENISAKGYIEHYETEEVLENE